jgi:sensor c-di-GMP phosphodiesterase-like protein
MRLPVMAEGVETQAQRDCLMTLGCNAFQGYLFSRPIPLEQFEELLAKEHIAPHLNRNLVGNSWSPNSSAVSTHTDVLP